MRLPTIQRTEDRTLLHVDERCFEWRGIWEPITSGEFRSRLGVKELETCDLGNYRLPGAVERKHFHYCAHCRRFQRIIVSPDGSTWVCAYCNEPIMPVK